MDSQHYLIVFISLVLSAFFSGMEIAFLSANKLQVELENKKGNLSAKIISRFLAKPDRFIGVMLVGNNIALVIYGIVMGNLILELLFDVVGPINSPVTLLIQTLISTLLILVTAEFIPKTLFRINPNLILNVFSVPLQIIYLILWVPMIIVTGLSNLLISLFLKNKPNADKQVVFGRVDLNDYIKEVTERVGDVQELDHEINIFQNALDFSKVKARDCMIPRNEIIAVEVEDSIDNISEKFTETGLSKIIVYRDSIDNIIGYVHSFNLFKKPENITSILTPVEIIPETTTANNIMKLLIKKSRSIAVVVDEFGGTSGMITLEDVVEEIFGDIEDEHDEDQLTEEVFTESSFLFSARLEIDYLNEKYSLNLPSSNGYETLAGFIISHHENLPEINEEIKIKPFHITIKSVSENKIDLVKVEVLEAED